jgi:hypothetical protein
MMHIKLKDGGPTKSDFISWRRLLEDTFRASGEISSAEEIVRIDVNEHGINYHVARKGASDGQ